MHDEPRMGAQVRVPASGSRHAGQVPATVDVVEPDLDAGRDAGACAQRCDVDRVLGRGGVRSDGEGAGDRVLHGRRYSRLNWDGLSYPTRLPT
ncbi:MAG TPA: hypothetical protein VN961_18515, partial [Streptosporangiaceae bacterium]|nr:hypothetical protein [Streptosporangiaceae bacterium]